MVSASNAVRAWSIRRLLSIGIEMGIYQATSLAAVLRSRQDIAYWKELLAKEPIEKLPTGDNMELCREDVLFEEGSPEWMSRSDLNDRNGQLKSLRVIESTLIRDIAATISNAKISNSIPSLHQIPQSPLK
jgi:hypothetical protein